MTTFARCGDWGLAVGDCGPQSQKLPAASTRFGKLTSASAGASGSHRPRIENVNSLSSFLVLWSDDLHLTEACRTANRSGSGLHCRSRNQENDTHREAHQVSVKERESRF